MTIGGFSPDVGRSSHGPIPAVILEGYDAATKTETISEAKLQGLHKETFWDSLKAQGTEKLVIACNDGKSVTYEKGMFNRLLANKPELADLTRLIPVEFSDQSERIEPKAKLCMCGTTIVNLFEDTEGERVPLPIVTPEDFQEVFHAIENEVIDISTYSEDVRLAMDFLDFHPVSLPEGVHGQKDWNSRGVDVGHVPPPPKELLEALNQPCPIAKDGSKMIDTHVILWMPPKLNDEPMTVNSLEKMATADAFGEHKIRYEFFDDSMRTDPVVNQPLEKGFWMALYKKPVAPGEAFENQKEYITNNCPGYEVPKVREVIAASFMQYGCSGDKKEFIFDNESKVHFVHCEEHISHHRTIFGGLSPLDLFVLFPEDDILRDDDDPVGVCPVRKFF